MNPQDLLDAIEQTADELSCGGTSMKIQIGRAFELLHEKLQEKVLIIQAKELEDAYNGKP